ncbi:DUF4058 family protein [Aquisphaera insulae]|uniref:DUF4058 family protein n=1 Tax=Aquisphaera insulae TaxID=2712864 RepID=UPI00202FE721|nr:DUF4058 family protein [Aquisphaera insulae]
MAIAPWAPPGPTLTLEADLVDPDEYEVRIYDARHERRLVAAIEIISPSNKDRPESRRAFVAKIDALLRRGICVTLVDGVTIRQFNLYADLLVWLGEGDPMLGEPPPAICSVTVRIRRPADRPSLVEAWFAPMESGRPLPKLPIWLDEAQGVSLDLEASYEEACRLLHIA